MVFDGPEYLTRTWFMTFNPDLPAPNNGFIITHPNNTGFVFAAPGVGMEEVYERHAGD